MVSGIPKRGWDTGRKRAVFTSEEHRAALQDATQSGMWKDVKPGPVVDLPSVVGYVCDTLV